MMTALFLSEVVLDFKKISKDCGGEFQAFQQSELMQRCAVDIEGLCFGCSCCWAMCRLRQYHFPEWLYGDFLTNFELVVSIQKKYFSKKKELYQRLGILYEDIDMATCGGYIENSFYAPIRPIALNRLLYSSPGVYIIELSSCRKEKGELVFNKSAHAIAVSNTAERYRKKGGYEGINYYRLFDPNFGEAEFVYEKESPGRAVDNFLKIFENVATHYALRFGYNALRISRLALIQSIGVIESKNPSVMMTVSKQANKEA